MKANLYAALILIMLIPSAVFSQCMSGIYTIGPVAIGSDYSTFTDAVNDLNANGVCGPVTFLVSNDGYYQEQFTIPTITGSSDSNTIAFINDPSNLNPDKPLIEFSPLAANPYVVLLDSASHIIFDGLWFALNEPFIPQQTMAAGILLRNGASDNSIRNCNLNTSGTNVFGFDYFNSTTAFNNNEISNSNIFLGSISLHGTYLGAISENNRIIKNHFFENSDLKIENVGNFLVDGNIFESPNVGDLRFAIFINACSGGGIVNGNSILNQRLHGIQLFGDSSFIDPLIISNNMISCGGYTAVGGINIKGIDIFHCFDVDVYNNNIGIYETMLPLYDAALYVQGTTNINIRNNNFCNFSNGLAMYFTGPSPSFVSNYNNFYSAGSVLIGTAFSQTFADLAAWQAHLPARDQNSISVDPLYVDSNNLHVAQIALRNKAIALPEILYDFDTEPRNSLPDIGADEFAAATDSVWPGDTDNDGICDANDLIPLGVYFNETGTPRAIVSNLFNPYYAEPYNIQYGNLNDAKFADCNGDGIINLNDTLALSNNSGLYHPLRSFPVSLTVTNRLHFIFDKDTVLPSENVVMHVLLESDNGITDSIYGFSFSATPNSFVDMYSIVLGQQNQSWGNYAIDYLAQESHSVFQYNLSAAVVALDHQNKKPAIVLDNFNIKFLNYISQGTWYSLPVTSAKLYDKNGNLIPATIIVDPVFIDYVTSINEAAIPQSQIFLQQENGVIQLRKNITSLAVYDYTGRKIFSKSASAEGERIKIPSIKNAVNILEFDINQKKFRYKIFNY